ncbi:ethionine resistance protein [Tieghemiomyces parasiticus]|uniref:Ethionine resistance protein n=1 Tax=Tieghemiomyces parasiticus TaxID=78921 RepID=A0A9W8AE86_9FUNG|nr:ethionine resistance protein [Tieghemiomyces parasiticus]
MSGHKASSSLTRRHSECSQSGSEVSTLYVVSEDFLGPSAAKSSGISLLGNDGVLGLAPAVVSSCLPADQSATERTALLSASSDELTFDAPEKWTWWDLGREAVVLGWLGAPMSVSYASKILEILVPGMVLGRLGTKAIVTWALSNSIASFTATGPLLGLLSALDTLCSQASTGSSRPGLSGIYLQRCVLLCLVAFLPSAILWWNIHPVLIYLKQDPAIISMITRYLRYESICFLFTIMFEAVKKFFIAQGFHYAISLIQTLNTPVNLVCTYVLVVHPTTSIGIVGIPASIAIANALGFLMAIVWFKAHGGSRGWTGLSWDAFRGWRQVARLAIPGAFMTSSDVVVLSLMTMAASLLGPVTLASHAVAKMTMEMLGIVQLGLITVTANRVGNLLGLAQPHRARNTAYAALLGGMGISVGLATLFYTLRHKWSYIFNPDPQVNAVVQHLVPILAVNLIFLVLALLSKAVLGGQGRPKIGAYMHLVVYYLAVIPFGLFTLYCTTWGLTGLWTALLLASTLMASGLLYFVLHSDWSREVRKCKTRLAHDELYRQPPPEVASV